MNNCLYKFKPGVLNTFSVIWVWKLKEHAMNNFHYIFEPDVLNTFSVIWVWKLKILQRMYGLISAFATQKLKANISFNIAREELKLSSIVLF